MSNIEINETAKELLNVRAMIEKLEAEAEALTDTIKTAMLESGSETLEGDGWKASWKNVNSTRFDSKRFKAENAELYEKYSKATVTTRFLIS